MAHTRLRVPLVLAVVTMSTTSAITAINCGGGERPGVDAATDCAVFCVYESTDNGNCPFPTCATGSKLDECPAGCIPEPIA